MMKGADDLVTTLYFITFLAALFMTGSLLLKNRKIDSLYILFGTLIVIYTLGRYMVAISPSLDVAILANKILYIGACYGPLALIMVLTQLCSIKMPIWLKHGMGTLSTIVLCLVMTIGRYKIYYADVKLGHEDGYNYLIKTYGPAHFIYPLLMAVYAFLLLFYLFYAIKKRNSISFRTVACISLLGFLVVFTYILERIIHAKASFLSLGYLVAALFMVNLFERINMYDMTSNIASSVDRLRKYGYLEFDNKFRFVNANKYVKELFPEIEKSWRIDTQVPESDSVLYKNVVGWLINRKDDESNTIEKDGHYFEVNAREVYYGYNRMVGYLVEIIDRTNEKEYLHTIENYNSNLEKEVEIKTADISHIKDMLVLGMASMVESRDNSTGGHIRRTSTVVDVFSKKLLENKFELQVDEEFLKMVSKAAPMHDLGKIAVADSVLQKKGKYTKEEYDEMKKHSAYGAKIVDNILSGVEDDEFVVIAKNVAHYHHEKWDGSGYPLGLKCENIPLEARIMALADVFDALVSKRCYKEAFTYDRAFSIIDESLGSHFDPQLGKIFISCCDELEMLYDSWNDEQDMVS